MACWTCIIAPVARFTGWGSTGQLLPFALGSIPAALGSTLGRCGLDGGAWTALRMTELVELRHASVRALFAEVDRIVPVCEWVREVLLRNDVPAEKITLCRQGMTL